MSAGLIISSPSAPTLHPPAKAKYGLPAHSSAHPLPAPAPAWESVSSQAGLCGASQPLHTARIGEGLLLAAGWAREFQHVVRTW